MTSENIPEDIRKLDAKIRIMRGADTESGAMDCSVVSRVGVAMAADLIAGVLVGTGIGYVLDMLLGTRPVLLVIFVLLGGAAGFLNMYRTVKDEERKDK